MPINYKDYPEDWLAIRAGILERSGNCCEGSPGFYPDCRAENGKPHPVTGSNVVLTIAHLDHDVNNNDTNNLRAMCQRCHLTYDAKHHAINAAETRRNKKLEAGQLLLFDFIKGKSDE